MSDTIGRQETVKRRRYLPESVWREVKVLAAKTDTTIDGLMRRGLDLVFQEHEINRGAADL